MTVKDRVIFRKFAPEDSYNSDTGDVIALFPFESYGCNNLIWSYMHIGQHSGASKDLITDLWEVSKEEYKDLAEELKSIGYNLQVMREATIKRVFG